MAVKDYNVEPELNVSISGINIAEGCAPSGINDAIRQLMADVKEESEAQAQAVGKTDAAVDALDSALRALVAEEVAKCLKIAGGTLEGPLCFGSSGRAVWDGDNKVMQFQAFGDDQPGAQIACRMHDAPELPGTLTLQGRNSDGSEGTAVIVHPSGAVEVGGSTVLTSAGGSVEGDIDLSHHILKDAESITLSPGGTPGHGGHIDFHFNASGEEYTSRIIENASGHLEVTASEGLYVNGQQVATASSGTAYSAARLTNVAAGKVSGNSFTLPDGGTWRYMTFTHNDVYVYSPYGGSAAGGTKITRSGGYPQNIIYIAVRCA